MTSNKTRVCALCGRIIPIKEYCNACIERVANLPEPHTMRIEERLAEFDSYDSALTIPFQQLHGRLEGLVGRPVWTHEFALWDRLRAEIVSGEQPTIEQIMGKATAINPNLKVITVVVD